MASKPKNAVKQVWQREPRRNAIPSVYTHLKSKEEPCPEWRLFMLDARLGACAIASQPLIRNPTPRLLPLFWRCEPLSSHHLRRLRESHARMVFCLWFGRGTPKDRDAAQAILARLKVLDGDECERARQEIGWGAGIKNLFRNLLP